MRAVLYDITYAGVLYLFLWTWCFASHFQFINVNGDSPYQIFTVNGDSPYQIVTANGDSL